VAARVTRVSGQLDPRSRTLLAEVDVSNRAADILPGSFVTVALQVKARGYPQVPAGALAVRRDTTFVVVVDSANRASFRRVVVARDDGQTAAIATGLLPGERVALNPGDGVTEGAKVQPVEAPGPPGRN
ncbi:MAG TPA: hypothetical protein VH137_10550, partial [Gemmatimonadales bacterium]|nr:hypothetical protein [Gemmatimonadales bacterium]